MVVLAAGGGHHLITYFQAIVIGLLQGVTELFPISSLGHAVILHANPDVVPARKGRQIA